MRFSIAAAAVAFAALASVVRGLAAPGPQETGRPPVSGSANPITSPLGNVALQPGKPYTIKWYVSYMRSEASVRGQGTAQCRTAARVSPAGCPLPGLNVLREPNFGKSVTLRLRKGTDSNNLDNVLTIVCMCCFPTVGVGAREGKRVGAGEGDAEGEADRKRSRHEQRRRVRVDAACAPGGRRLCDRDRCRRLVKLLAKVPDRRERQVQRHRVGVCLANQQRQHEQQTDPQAIQIRQQRVVRDVSPVVDSEPNHCRGRNQLAVRRRPAAQPARPRALHRRRAHLLPLGWHAMLLVISLFP